MKFKEITKNPIFENCLYYITLHIHYYVSPTKPCSAFDNEILINAEIPWQETNIAKWEIFNKTDLDTNKYVYVDTLNYGASSYFKMSSTFHGYKSYAGSCVAICFSLFRIYVSINDTIPQQIEKLNNEIRDYEQLQEQQQQPLLMIFVFIDCVFNLLPLVFNIPLLVILAKLLICLSVFWTPRFRKLLQKETPLVFSLVLNSPILPLCIISSPVWKLVSITVATVWTSLPLDFNHVLKILGTVYLVWRIISGLCSLLIARAKKYEASVNKSINEPTNTAERLAPLGIFIYALIKLSVWVTGVRAIWSMIFASGSPPPNPAAFVTVSPEF
ncbi:10190_t:CDS:2 [Ambispora gerdemannii]|uniref:10190_t:CDS:1 n=1 Tax=Ambispora gerdemannii TaxID=144530 RepID=A0A9N9GDG9_9GLOM|nr:10190_t:CDS:2 [Ambispora gerdemannii]